MDTPPAAKRTQKPTQGERVVVISYLVALAITTPGLALAIAGRGAVRATGFVMVGLFFLLIIATTPLQLFLRARRRRREAGTKG